MIVTENLSKHFKDFIAVSDISISVAAGEVLALLGPNGAGKTTTVRMLTSVLLPTSGKALVAGYDTRLEPQRVRASVGVLTEQHGLYERMRAWEYLIFFGEIYGLAPDRRAQRATELLEWFGLTEDRQRRLGEYSKGMRQKLALARALLHDPPILLLDEPTSAMDPESARLVRDSLHALRSEQRAILICTHNLAEAEELADQIAIIRRGRIILQGSPDDLKRRLLGAPEFLVRLKCPLNGRLLDLPQGASNLAVEGDTIRYITPEPDEYNPRLLAWLQAQGLPVITLSEAPRSLEQVYLQAVSSAEEAWNGAGQELAKQQAIHVG